MPSSPPKVPVNNLKFAYTPRVADLWRILKDIQDELVHEGDHSIISQIQDLIAHMEMRDKELEDYITPQYRSRVYSPGAGTNQSIPSGLWTTVTFTTVNYDVLKAFGTGPTYSTFTAPVNGYYFASAAYVFNPFAANNIAGRFIPNSHDYLAAGPFHPALAGSIGGITAVDSFYLNAGDTLQFQVYQDSGVAETPWPNQAGDTQFFSVHIMSSQVYS